MPEVSRFFGIIVRMFFADHPPPHFHADYGGRAAVVAISPLAVLESDLPGRALAMVLERAACISRSLLEDWERLRSGQPLVKIPPLT
ncbi:MAG: DUF4160 domain-containing protein [Candidatus Moduliflexus flocculans]|nr:DUF4160 domain-containing protein [Candidatus Moduliflexus flocculans]